MRLLLDNCVDIKFAALIPDHDVAHALERGWEVLENGKLLAAAEAAGFDALVTVDKNLQYQQSLKGRKISVITLNPRFVFYAHIAPLAAKLALALQDLPPGSFITISPTDKA